MAAHPAAPRRRFDGRLPRLPQSAADKFFILSTGHSTNGLDAVVEVSGKNVKMTRPIEDLVFDEK